MIVDLKINCIEVIGLPEYGTKTIKEFIEEMNEVIRKERSLSSSEKKYIGDRYRLIVTQKGDSVALLRPIVNIRALDTVILKDLDPDQAEQVIEAGIAIGIVIKKPLGYNLSIPLMEMTLEDFLQEMKEVVRHGRATGREYELFVTRSGDQQAYLRPIKSRNIFDTLVVKDLNPDEGKTTAKAGDNLGIKVKRPLYYSI